MAERDADWDAEMKALKDTLTEQELCATLGLDLEPRNERLNAQGPDFRQAMLVRVARTFFHHILVDVHPTSNRKFKLVPEETWSASVKYLVGTVNGAGEFFYPGVTDFLRSGPYTPRQGVLSHIHWLAEWHKVYGGMSPNDTLDSFLNGRKS